MWNELPDDIRLIVFDFYGDTTMPHHRRRCFLLAEIASFKLFCDKWDFPLLPSFIIATEGFRECLELMYAHSDNYALIKCIP